MGFLKKIFKPFKKIFKKIGKGIKKAFTKIGKWSGKLGVFAQVATMFIPGLGPMLGGLFKGLGKGALNLLGKGLSLNNPLAKGAAWLVDTARIVGGKLTQGFSSLTKAATDFIGGTTKFLANKIPGNPFGVEGMTGTFKESVLDVVGKNFTENFPGLEKTFNELMTGPKGRSELINTKLTEMSTVSFGGVDIDTRKIPDFTEKEASEMLGDISEGYINKGGDLGTNATNAISKYISKYTNENSKNPFGDTLNFITDNPDYMNTLVQSTPEQMKTWNDFMSGVKDANDPFKQTLKTTLGSLLSPKKIKEELQAAPAKAAGQYFQTAITGKLAGDPKQPEKEPVSAMGYFGAPEAMYQNQLLSQNIMTPSPDLMGQTSFVGDGIISQMSPEGLGMPFIFGPNGTQRFKFPGAQFGFSLQ